MNRGGQVDALHRVVRSTIINKSQSTSFRRCLEDSDLLTCEALKGIRRAKPITVVRSFPNRSTVDLTSPSYVVRVVFQLGDDKARRPPGLGDLPEEEVRAFLVFVDDADIILGHPD